MGVKRRRIEASVKAKAALAAIRGDRTTSELASQFKVHPTQIGHWKRRLLEGAGDLFSVDRRREVQEQEALIADLYEQIGRLQMELAWLKKKLAQLD
jgi:transposase-like protein